MTNNPPPRRLHEQIADHLRQRIIAGEWAPGEQMPTIGKLAGDWPTSYDTMWEAVRILTGEGLVEPRRGSGLYRTDRAAPDEPDRG